MDLPLKPNTGSDQRREFVKSALELGADNSEEACDNVLKRVVSALPPKSVQKRKSQTKKRSR